MTDLISEKDFQRTVLDLLHALKYKTYHPFLSIASDPGFPDIVATRGVDDDWPFEEETRWIDDEPFIPEHTGGRILFIELKTEKGQPTFEQWNWLRILQAMGYDAYLERPSDFEEMAVILR